MTIPISGGVLPRLLRLSLLAAGVASLLATGSDPQGPPPPPPQSCAATVNSGFSGALDWVAGDTGVGAGADGEGGVGIQVSLGVSPVVGAVVTVRKADGTTLGSAPTGSDGRVTLKACDTAGPFLVEAQGVSGATYFDAAVRPAGARVAFGAGTSMRAVVPALSANIGVTPWTEAVVQRLLGASKPAPGPLPSASAIDEAHRYVRDNAYSTLLPDALGIDSLTLLPATTSSATLADSASDRYALALAALGEVAAMFNASLPTPALSAAQQFAVDAADGRVDGRAADGSAVASVGQLAYAAGTLRQSLDVGLAVAASRYATSALQDRLPATLALGAVSLPDGSGTSAQRAVRLGRDGSVVLLDADGSAGAAISSDAVALYGASQTPASALFVRRWDGTVVALGDGGPAGLLGLGAGMKLATATEVAALRDVTSISVGTAHALARKSDGGVLGWGDAGRGGLLGVTSGVVLPLAQPGIAQAIGVLALNDLSFALLQDGRVLAWGAGAAGLGNGSTASQLQPAAQAVLSGTGGELTQVQALAGFANGNEATLAALRLDGKVWTWGENTHGGLGASGVARASAAEVAGLADIVGLAATDRGFVAVDAAGVLYFWGSVPVAGEPGTPTSYSDPFPPHRIDGLAAVRSVQPAFAGLFQAKVYLRDGDRWQTDGVGARQSTAANELDVHAVGAGILTIDVVSGDGIVNAAERAAGVAVSGTITEADRPVTVYLGGAPIAALVNGTTWTASLPASSLPTTGPVTISASFTNAAGLPSEPTSRTFVVDAVPPAVSITDNIAADVTDGPILFTFTWTKPPVAFSSELVTVPVGTRGAFAQLSPTTYSLQVTPPTESAGNVTVTVAAGVVRDSVGNPNVVETRATQAFETLTPQVTINGPVIGYVSGPATLTFDWNVPVTGFDAGDVIVDANTATKGPLVQIDATHYSMLLTPTQTTFITADVTIPAGAARDQLGHESLGSRLTFNFMGNQDVLLDFSGGPGGSGAGGGGAGDAGTPGNVPKYFPLFLASSQTLGTGLTWTIQPNVDTDPLNNVAYYLVLRRERPDAEPTKYARIAETSTTTTTKTYVVFVPFENTGVSYRVRACNGGSGVGSGGGTVDENWCTDSNEVGYLNGTLTEMPREYFWPDIKPLPAADESYLHVTSISATGTKNGSGEFTGEFQVQVFWNAGVDGFSPYDDVILDVGTVTSSTTKAGSNSKTFSIAPPPGRAGTVNLTIKDCAVYSLRASPNCSPQETASFKFRTP